MITLSLLTALAQPRWTGRTPIGEPEPGETDVQVQSLLIELQILSFDEVQVRSDYLLLNPTDTRQVVHLSVPVTSGGPEGERASPAAASVRFLDAGGTFVPCLVRERAPARELPVRSTRGVHRVDHHCTADVVVPPGPSSLRMSYEGALLFDEPDGVLPASDRTLVHDLQGAAGWSGAIGQLDVIASTGPFGGIAGPIRPANPGASGDLVHWSAATPDPVALGPVVVPLGGEARVRADRVAKGQAGVGAVHRVLADGDLSTTRCGPSRVRFEVAPSCGPVLWTTPEVPLQVVDCTSGEDRVGSTRGLPGGRQTGLLPASTCYELRPEGGACLAEVAVRPCPSTPGR